MMVNGKYLARLVEWDRENNVAVGELDIPKRFTLRADKVTRTIKKEFYLYAIILDIAKRGFKSGELCEDDKGAYIYASKTDLSKASGLSFEQVKYYIRKLKEHKLIETEPPQQGFPSKIYITIAG